MPRRNAFDKLQEKAPPSAPEISGWNTAFSEKGTETTGWAETDLPGHPATNEAVEVPEPRAEDTPSGRSHIEGIPTAQWQPKPRKKDMRKRETPRKLPLIPSNKTGIETHAGRLNIPAYELLRYLLEYGLDQVEHGNLHFEPQLAPNGLTLYPQEAKPRKTRTKRSDLIKTAYRGIPDKTWNELKKLATYYPLWQVLNKLLEFGIEQLEGGELILTPQHIGTKTLY